jgi:hypothetical protein
MLIPEDYAQVNHFFTGAGMPRGGQVTYGVLLIAGATPTQVATEVSNIFEARWKSAMPSSITHSKVRVKFGPNEDGPFVDGGSSFAGTYSTAVDSPQVAVLMRKDTGFGGRHGSGRLFMPIVPEADTQSGGNIDPTALAALQSRATTWIADLLAGTYVDGMHLLHNAAPPNPYLVTGLSVQQLLATQRRRIRKVGGRRRVEP